MRETIYFGFKFRIRHKFEIFSLFFLVAAQANNFTEMMDQEKAKLTAAREAWEEEKAKVLFFSSLFFIGTEFSY